MENNNNNNKRFTRPSWQDPNSTPPLHHLTPPSYLNLNYHQPIAQFTNQIHHPIQLAAANINPKKRRAPPKDKLEDDATPIKPKPEQNEDNDSAKKKGKGSNASPPEPPKDYIHVRARRGEATDSHSLAERVRRERIGERMKFLQDLVPGCEKVTGKAGMLDEIINYVQSLQQQVEFLSMKLATVHPQLDFEMDNFNPKEPNQASGHVASNSYAQLGAFWVDDFQGLAPMSFSQNHEAAFSSQSFFHGRLI